MWYRGQFNIQNNIFSWAVKVADKPSKVYGINGGKIIKLSISLNGSILCCYDRGWDASLMLPGNGIPYIDQIYNALIIEYNN